LLSFVLGPFHCLSCFSVAQSVPCLGSSRHSASHRNRITVYIAHHRIDRTVQGCRPLRTLSNTTPGRPESALVKANEFMTASRISFQSLETCRLLPTPLSSPSTGRGRPSSAHTTFTLRSGRFAQVIQIHATNIIQRWQPTYTDQPDQPT